MIHIQGLTFNSFQVNTYLVWDEKGDCLVVDPAFYDGEERTRFESFIAEHSLRIAGQVNTHAHIDHILGVLYIQSRHKHPFRAHREETSIATNAHLMGEIFGLSAEPLSGIDQYVEDGELISAGSYSLRTLFVPGHSPGSLAFYSPEGAFVIAGDALFSGSIGRTDLPGGNYDRLIHSIQSRLLVLPTETTVYPGHGPPTTIGKEARDNPFLAMAQ